MDGVTLQYCGPSPAALCLATLASGSFQAGRRPYNDQSLQYRPQQLVRPTVLRQPPSITNRVMSEDHAPAMPQCRVIHYILASKRFRSSMRDCRVYSVVDVKSDHRLLVLDCQAAPAHHLQPSSSNRQPTCSACRAHAAQQHCSSPSTVPPLLSTCRTSSRS